ncbi:MAG TPA: flagella basal body P-ring formation protein FlgA [Sulfurimonas sp. UBA10385]|nr:MAG TPA: flagella basal body P-ring formation protein FlgA [Sulfurimonas sp. UBA10385]
MKNDFELYTIEANRYSKRVKAKDLIKLLDKKGYKNYTSKSSYINFIIKSPVNTSALEQHVKEYYRKKYDNIEIKNISVHPRGYITSLPKDYIFDIDSRDYLSRSGIISIKTSQNKKIFFDYDIEASVAVYTSRSIIKKDTQISLLNVMRQNVVLDRFRAKPLQNIEANLLQSKRHIPKDMILTIRDVESLDVVKKDSIINVSLFKDGMGITFSAKALQDAKVNDIIKVQNSNQKILKARVTGKNTAEIE